ncbi:UNVERIFIED_CONTAM: hypothetical protein Slati_1517700 [Sesamum latifolium]|uniref:Uncharacterized protein n=1 Tax=Sesamum latifolium TaxID=2727402 RepID=A0AAW2X6Z3_9LAMI
MSKQWKLLLMSRTNRNLWRHLAPPRLCKLLQGPPWPLPVDPQSQYLLDPRTQRLIPHDVVPPRNFLKGAAPCPPRDHSANDHHGYP